MTSLKAFVGHSFTTDDEDVVRTFLKYFDQVEELSIGFSWEHAEPAETKELAEKVLRLMECKNLFIGICTKKGSNHPSKRSLQDEIRQVNSKRQRRSLSMENL